jgi:hypothetical protein
MPEMLLFATLMLLLLLLLLFNKIPNDNGIAAIPCAVTIKTDSMITTMWMADNDDLQ